MEQKVAGISDTPGVDARAELSSEEQAMVRAALYPFKERQAGVSIPRWASEIVQKLELPTIADARPPVLKVTAPANPPRSGTPEQIAAYYAPAVAYITSRDGASGSGALISGDGLVLTAAHVLTTAPFQVSFPGSGDKRSAPAELVFANEAHDVALLRVKDYRGSKWFEVAFSDAPAAGEPVVALGNPHIPGSGTALGSVSDGIVAKPYDPKQTSGTAGLIASVGVASGSSGGPLLSRKNGK